MYAADAGENLAVDFSDSDDVTNAWMDSPGHRANILNANFTEIGMATAPGTFEGHPTIYVVELFGTPLPAPPAAEIAASAFVNTAAAAGGTSSSVAAKASATTTRPKSAAKPAPKFAPKKPAKPAVAAANLQTATAAVPALAGIARSVPSESNPVQNAFANSRQLVDDIYLAVIALFALALGLNIFVKIRVQHPQLIFGGMLVILVAGLFIVLNQHLLASAAVL